MYFKKRGISVKRGGFLILIAILWFAFDFLGLFVNVLLKIHTFDTIPYQHAWNLSFYSPLEYFWFKIILASLFGGGLMIAVVYMVFLSIASLRDKDSVVKTKLYKKLSFSFFMLIFGLGLCILVVTNTSNISYFLARQSQVVIQVNSTTHRLEMVSHLGVLPVSKKSWALEEIAAIEINHYRYQRTIKNKPSGYQVIGKELNLRLKSGKTVLLAFLEWKINWHEKKEPPLEMFDHPRFMEFCNQLNSQFRVSYQTKEVSKTNMIPPLSDFIQYPSDIRLPNKTE